VLTGLLSALLAVLGVLAPAVAPAGRVCGFTDDRITESSGLAFSTSGSVLFTHNDSGDTARFFAIDPLSCRTTATYRLAAPAEAFDWEDMARATAEDGTPVLLLGDIGDNLRFRDHVTVYEVGEPSGRATDPRAEQTVAVRAVYDLVYPDGPVDAESLAALPDGRLLVVTKDKGGHSQVYATARRPEPGTTAMTTLADLRLTSVTGADVTRDGRWLAVRTLTTAYLYDLRRGFTDPTVLPLTPRRQGEAIAWSPDGAFLMTSSEGAGGVVDRYRVPPLR
jgi:hypothetical protein